MTLRLLTAAAVALVAGSVAAEAPKAAFPGAEAAVVVNRVTGKVAASLHGSLLVFERFGAPAPLIELELPGMGGAVREFAGANLVYATAGINDQPLTLVAVTDQGMERLAWPNEGLSESFPTETSRLTLDGKGLYDRLVLDAAVREYFELPEDIPDGAGVAATFRFAGEKMAARASEAFLQVLALSPDDLLIVSKAGGVLRYRAGQGVVWKFGEGSVGLWRLLDADAASGTALVLDGRGALLGVDLEKGTERWRFEPAARPVEIAAWLGEPAPASGPAAPSAGKAATPAPTATPAPRTAPRVVDARVLRDGRVLMLGGGSRTWLGVLDGAAGALHGRELLVGLEAQGLTVVASLWRDKGAYLAWAQEAATPVGPALLLRGTDGWYAVPLPQR